LESSTELSASEYVKLTQDSRKQRRELKKVDYEKYEELVLKYILDTEVILEKNINEIIEALNLTKELFENSI
jgi:hypothetical protein